VTLIYILLAGSVGLIIGMGAGRRLLIIQNRGEALVTNTLAELTCPHALLNNVTLPTEDGTTQVDHILNSLRRAASRFWMSDK